MRKLTDDTERKVDDILNYPKQIKKIMPSDSFSQKLLERYDKELGGKQQKRRSLLPYLRIAASLLALVMLANLLILISSIKQTDVPDDVLSGYSEEFVSSQDEGWFDMLASGTYYDFNENKN